MRRRALIKVDMPIRIGRLAAVGDSASEHHGIVFRHLCKLGGVRASSLIIVVGQGIVGHYGGSDRLILVVL